MRVKHVLSASTRGPPFFVVPKWTTTAISALLLFAMVGVACGENTWWPAHVYQPLEEGWVERHRETVHAELRTHRFLFVVGAPRSGVSFLNRDHHSAAGIVGCWQCGAEMDNRAEFKLEFICSKRRSVWLWTLRLSHSSSSLIQAPASCANCSICIPTSQHCIIWTSKRTRVCEASFSLIFHGFLRFLLLLAQGSTFKACFLPREVRTTCGFISVIF